VHQHWFSINKKIMKLFLHLFFFITSLHLYAQQDTAAVIDVPVDFAPDTTISVKDTLSRRYDVDTTIFASSTDSLIFYINERKMDLFGKGELKYKDTDLKSENIFVDFETSNIEAVGIPSDTARRGYTGTPVLVEKGEKYEGVRMKYNFRTQRGHISSAGTEMEGASYTGAKIKKVDTETYFIEDGIYTTCPLDIPHYHFYSNEMKVIHKEQIISKWIWLTFGGVPFPIPLPFAVFPIESGRRSGILPPAFGDDPQRGRYFSRFGYFWAISDYMDMNATADFYTRGSYNLNSQFRYAKRYNFTGNLNGGYSYDRFNEVTDPDYGESVSWRVRWNHNQSINPTTRFDANLEFMSGTNYLTRNTIQLSELLRQEIISNATLHKSWDESGNSLSMSYRRTQDITSGDIREVLPNALFNMAQSYPFRGGISRNKWYESFGYSYSSELRNNRNKIGGDLRVRGGIQHNIRTSFAPKIGFFNFTPQFSYQERWYNKRIEQYYAGVNFRGGDSIVTEDVKEINFVRSFNTGISASTRFYGIVQPNTLGIAALRHTVTPSINYNYTPDFSTSFWGYYGEYINSRGETVKYSRYRDEVFGTPGAVEQQSIGLSITNIFEMKTTVDPTDTTSKEKKIQLLNVDVSTAYNFAADSLQISPLNLGARTQVGEWFNLRANSTFSPYEQDEQGRTLNQLLWNTRGVPLRLMNFGFSLSTSLSGERLRPKEPSEVTAPEDEFQLGTAENRVYQGLYDEREADFTIPWDISLTYNYNFSRINRNEIRKNSNITGGVNFNLTPSWKFSFSGSYDIDNKEIAAPSVRVSRDLHCWVMNFTWYPLGRFRGYQFEIRVKAPQLQDLKITKRDSFFSGK
jgi:lipopolysaccharide assembly outer membrane protein LptD (OstA)